ncbi:MAG: Ada metal-binding domain-containing protein [Spirosomataceae bacterium]
MFLHDELSPQALHSHIRQGRIVLGGNKKLKIYGTLRCPSGKRLKKANRVFFESEQEALANGYRPCGHCLKTAYLQWNYSQSKRT